MIIMKNIAIIPEIIGYQGSRWKVYLKQGKFNEDEDFFVIFDALSTEILPFPVCQSASGA